MADTSVWIAHFRKNEPALADRLVKGFVVMHPWICGELACGNLKTRDVVLSHLQALPQVKVLSNGDVLSLLESRQLWGRGLGWVDMQLLASALVSGCGFWTFDKRLATVAAEIGIGDDHVTIHRA